MMRRFIVTGLLALGGLIAWESTASAQEIQLTGPLAGAPAVRNLRWHRKGRFEIAPTLSFTLLDEYQRTMLAGARLNYNVTDWLALGVWGAYGAVHMNTGLTDEIQKVSDARWSSGWDAPVDTGTGKNPSGYTSGDISRNRVDRNASVLSVGKNMKDQLGTIQWVVSPQITAVPFRGKLAIFHKAFVDTELYFFGGPAFVGLKERADFTDLNKLKTGDNGLVAQTYDTATRVAIAPTFGAGLTFFTGKATGLGVEYRALPFSWNTSGFDSRGGAPSDKGPDSKVDTKDREFKFNQMITISFSVFLPTDLKLSP
jgi:hypothetical protein